MKQMIDPNSLNFDDKYIKKDGVAANSDDIKCQTIADSSKAQIKFYSSDVRYPSGVWTWKKGPGIIVYSDSNYYNPPFISIGHSLNSGSDSEIWEHMNPEPHGSNSDDQFITISYKNIICRSGNGKDTIEFPCAYRSGEKTAIMCTDKTLKTLFGQKIYSKDGTGNIDLYKHNLKGVSGDNQVYISIPSSKNTPINSITDLNTYLSNDDYYPATGVYKDGTTFYPIVFMTKSNNVWSVTYNKGTELGTALISAVAVTITDTVTTV